MKPRQGYILFEAVAALAVLSIGVAGIQQGFRQALLFRATAEDYTRAACLIDQLFAEVETQPLLVEMTEEGQFPAPNARFSWSKKIELAAVPLQGLPPEFPADIRTQFEVDSGVLGRVTVTVKWTRLGETFERAAVTLLPPGRMWRPRPQPGEAGR